MRIDLAAVLSLTAMVLIVGCRSAPPSQTAAAGAPVVPVSVAVAAVEPVPVEIRAVGSVEPYQTVQVKSQIAGELLRVRFVEGGQIKKGDLLFQIDPLPYRQALRQAEA